MKKFKPILPLLAITAACLALTLPANATETEEIHSHNVSQWTAVETGHSGLCDGCGETVLADHNYSSEETAAATCQQAGVITFTCIDCGHSYTEEIPQLIDHIPGEWVADETHHTGACIHCQADLSADHVFAEGEITAAPTCTAEGKQIHFCTVCGYEKEVTLPVIDHSYDEGIITQHPTCQAPGVLTFTCGCGHSYTEEIPQLEDHIPGEWISNETQHTGTCIHCQADLSADHVFAEGEITAAPTCTAEGKQIHFCTVCGYEKEVTLPVIDHSYDEGVITQQATCQQPGVLTFTCGCGHSCTEEIPQLEDHIPGEWISDEIGHIGACIHCQADLSADHVFAEGDITADPTCTTEGKQIHFCTVCGYEKEVTLSVIDHSYDEGIIVDPPTCQKEGLMTFTCSCGHTYDQVVPQLEHHVCSQWTAGEETHTGVCDFCETAMEAPHSYDQTEILTPPTCQAPGLMRRICVCGLSYEEEIPQLPDHVPGEWTYDEFQHASSCIHCGAEILGEHQHDQAEITTPPTCQASGILTHRCVCGHSYEEEIPQLTDHVAGEWTHNETHHISNCIHCGTEIQVEHSYGEGEITLPPTCTTEGAQIHFCTVCGYETEVTLPADGHAYGEWTTVNLTKHQHICHCGHVEQTNHTWDEGTILVVATCSKEGKRLYACTDCGQTRTIYQSELPHTYDNNCDISCNVCGNIRRTTHQFESQWTFDENEHWHECKICGSDGSLEAHIPGDWIIDQAPGEYTAGQKHQNCTVCGAVAKTETIPATGCLHGNEVLLGQKDPTCSEKGYTGDLTCPRCQTVVQYGQAIDKLPHTIQLQNQKDPTCVDFGYSGDEICTVCLATVTEGHVVGTLPHNTQLENYVAPTCAATGYSGDEVCLDCGEVVTEGQILDLLPHTTQLQGKQAPTCAVAGYTGDEVCQDCHAVVKEGESIDTLPHTIRLRNKWDADCMEEGYSGDEFCTTCQQVIHQGHTLPKTDHRYEDGVCLDCQQLDPSDPNATKPNFDSTPNIQYEEPGIDPMIIVCIVLLVVTGGGLVVMIILVAKKK